MVNPAERMSCEEVGAHERRARALGLQALTCILAELFPRSEGAARPLAGCFGAKRRRRQPGDRAGAASVRLAPDPQRRTCTGPAAAVCQAWLTVSACPLAGHSPTRPSRTSSPGTTTRARARCRRTAATRRARRARCLSVSPRARYAYARPPTWSSRPSLTALFCRPALALVDA